MVILQEQHTLNRRECPADNERKSRYFILEFSIDHTLDPVNDRDAIGSIENRFDHVAFSMYDVIPRGRYFVGIRIRIHAAASSDTDFHFSVIFRSIGNGDVFIFLLFFLDKTPFQIFNIANCNLARPRGHPVCDPGRSAFPSVVVVVVPYVPSTFLPSLEVGAGFCPKMNVPRPTMSDGRSACPPK